MEYVSILAGERFSDRPKTTHCALAAIARVANDVVSDGFRPRLLPLAPSLVGTARAGYDVDPALVTVVAARARDLQPESAQAREALAGATRRLRHLHGGRTRRMWFAATARGYRSSAAVRMAQLLADDIAPAGDVQVLATLERTTDELRRAAGPPPTGSDARQHGRLQA